VFVRSVNIAKWEIYLASLCDFASFAAARLGEAEASEAEMRDLAVTIVATATARETVPIERPQGFDDIHHAFAERAKRIDWHSGLPDDSAFQASLAALVEWAPIADELKNQDVAIIKNSMRHRWRKVRDQLAQLLAPGAVLADWRARQSSDSDAAARLS